MKRQRTTQGGRTTGFVAKRPIDKELIAINRDITTAQVETTLTSATFPCTVTGLRWSIGVINTYAGNNPLYWAIVLVKDGNAASGIATSNGSSLYQPEQNVLAFGVCELDNPADGGVSAYQFEGSTKSMRKLMGGDQLLFIANAGANGYSIRGAIQFFCKT